MATRSKKRSKGLATTPSYDTRSSRWIRSACTCFERYGVKKTSITMIADTMGVTRELLYYYFDGKGAIADSVVDLYVDRLAKRLRSWSTRHGANSKCPADQEFLVAAQDLVTIVRRAFFTTRGKQSSMAAVLNELDVMPKTVKRVCEQVVMSDRAGGFVSSHNMSDYMLAFIVLGIYGMLVADFGTDDTTLAQTVLLFCEIQGPLTIMPTQ